MREFRIAKVTVAVAAVVWFAWGCRQAETPPTAAHEIDENTFNDLAVRTVFEQQARGAAAAERSIYSHHFEPATASLNELGVRQVDILAAAYRGTGKVEVNVADHGATSEERAKRLEAVRRAFAERGVAAEDLNLVAGRPGGPGLPSGHVIGALIGGADGESGSGSRNGGSPRSRDASGTSGRLSGSPARSSGMSGSSGQSSGGR